MKKRFRIPTACKTVIATLICLFTFSAIASARKVYIAKFNDNGFYNNGGYAPGDTLVLRASLGAFDYFSLENVHGAAWAPIVILNEGGQVQLTRMEFRHCTFIKLTGTGASSSYGFLVTNPWATWVAAAVSITGRSSDMEVDHVDINQTGYGFWVKEESSCIDSLQYPNWRINNISIHDNRLQNLAQEGIYAGSTAPNGERGVTCNGVTIYPMPIRLGNIKIYNNIIYHTTRAGIQLSAADYGTNEIYNNNVSNCGYEFVQTQGNGILLGTYTTAYVHDNVVDNTYSTGIFSLGSGLVRIENNRVDHSGQLEGRTADLASSIMVDTRLTTPVTNTTFYVKNNTLGANSDVGIRVYDTYPTYNLGNLICNNVTTAGSVASIYVQGITDWSSCTTNTTTSSSGSTLRIEAENYSAMTGIQTENTSDAGGGLNVAWQDDNDWMDYNVNIATAGTYTVNFRVASMFAGAQYQLRKYDGTVLASMTVPNTGSFQTWQTISAQVSLPAGQQRLRIYTYRANGGWNINWWEIAGASNGTMNQLPQVNAGSAQTITLPANSVQLNGSATDADGSITSYSWSQVSGPSPAIFSSAASASTTASGLVQGSYTFQLTAKDNTGAAATANVVITVNGTASFATTSSIKIEAENFSAMNGIQTENTSDAGGGSNVGWQDDNDWMDYAVNISSAGTYTVNFRVASMFSGAQFQLRNSSGVALATLTVPNTGNFQAWQTISAQVTLPAGQQTLRIVTTKANGGWNINWWEIQGTTSATNTPANIRIEAESYGSMNGIQTENTADAGGGLNVGWQDNNDWMDYAVNIPTAGTYTVNFRVASMFSGAQFQLRGSNGYVMATVTVPNTGSFQSWQTVSAQVAFSAGQQTLRIVTTQANGGWNLNWWEILSASTSMASVGTAEVVPSTTAALEIFPNPVSDRFALKVNNTITGSMQVQLYDMTGALKKTFTVKKNNSGILQTYLSLGTMATGTYIVRVTMNNWSESIKLLKQ